jgi:hypothetical protein
VNLERCLQALRIIKHLSTKGCSHFQRCMQRQSTAVRYAPWDFQQEQQADTAMIYLLMAAQAAAAARFEVVSRDIQSQKWNLHTIQKSTWQPSHLPPTLAVEPTAKRSSIYSGLQHTTVAPSSAALYCPLLISHTPAPMSPPSPCLSQGTYSLAW